MKTFKVKMYGKEYELYCKRFKYAYPENTMIQLYEVNGEPYGILSTNPGFKLGENEFYSCPNNYGSILCEMVGLKLIKMKESIWRSGYNIYQGFIINEKVFSQYEKENI